MSDDEARESKFDLALGEGTPLGQLSCFMDTPTRGAAAQQLEAAIEPLHRFVFSRPGVGGQRRAALADFKGFPSDVKDSILERCQRLSKDKLRGLVKALNMPVHVSMTVGEVAAGVTDFLMCPIETKKRKPASTVAAKRPRAASSSQEKKGSSSESAAKVAKSSSPSNVATEDRVRVEVYRRVLRMAASERATLGVKALRTDIESALGLEEGALKIHKDTIAETASECVRALLAAESRATTGESTGASPCAAADEATA